MAISKLISALLLLTFSTTFVVAQENSNSKKASATNQASAETVFLHCNASTFVTGETLYYKFYNLNAADHSTSMISKVGYVELISSDKKIIFSQKLFLKNGVGQSDFLLSNAIQTGNYKIIAYTQWMQNSSKNNFFEKEITIINPFEAGGQKDIIGVDTNTTSGKTNTSILVNKNLFATREKVNLRINDFNTKSKKGTYSISVRRKEDLPENSKISAADFSSKKDYSKIILNSNTLLPELRGELLYGKISSLKAANVNNISVALSITGNPFIFKIVQTNATGDFIFNIDKNYINSEIIIQVLDTKAKEYTITLKEKNLIDYNAINFGTKGKLNTEYKSAIQNRSVASQIQSSYAAKKTDSITNILSKEAFYEPLAKEYSLDDYTRFSTLKETITEVVSEMNYAKKDGNYYFYLKDYHAKSQLSEPSLVLFDGLLVQNASEIINFKSENIKKIAIIPTGYNYGPKVFNGLISIISKENSSEKPTYNETYWLKKQIKTPEISKKYFQQDYSDATKYNRIPDYRYQLLWKPNFDTEELSFYTSDITGTFEILLEGFTEAGEPISGKTTFEVK